MTLTPAERVLRARLGAHTLHSLRDPRETTAAARAAFAASFEEKVDPGLELAPAERARRAASARRAYFMKLALKSARVRRRNGTTALEGGRPEDMEARHAAAKPRSPD